MSVTFFDMDGTLVDADTNSLFFSYMYEHKIIDDEFLEPMPSFHQRYFTGSLKIEDFIMHSIQPIVGMSKEQRDFIVKDCVQKLILPKVKTKAKEAIEFHRKRQDTLVVVSATVDYLITQIAHCLDIEHVIAAPIALDEKGVVQNKIAGIVPYQQGKVARILDFINKNQLSLDDSYAYGDSINDIEMLKLVTHGFCVDPSLNLQRHKDFKLFKSLIWKDTI